MVDRRRWTGAEFRDAVRRRTRCCGTSSGGWCGRLRRRRPPTSFRVAEDRTLADVDDDAVDAARRRARRRRAPAATSAATLAAWSEVFADYEILQPFPQLGRARARADRRGARRARADAVRGRARCRPAGCSGWTQRGWRRGDAAGRRRRGWIARPLPGGRHASSSDLDPGIAVGAVDEFARADARATSWLEPTGATDVLATARDRPALRRARPGDRLRGAAPT